MNNQKKNNSSGINIKLNTKKLHVLGQRKGNDLTKKEKLNDVCFVLFCCFILQQEHVFAFKQARRREDDIAIVNTAMRVLLEKQANSTSWQIKDCSFSFGGMAPTTVMAVKTIKGLTGR